MESSEKEFIILAVKRVFDKIKRGQVYFVDKVPETVREIKAVRFGAAGDPIYETIGPLVRALAREVIGHDLERETEERKSPSPVHQLFGERVDVRDETLQDCVAKKSFSPLALELYDEAVRVLNVCSQAHGLSGEFVLLRRQAICAGLLVRIAKFMTAVTSLVSQDSYCGDVVFALNRSITESATNLRFLAIKNEDRFFDQFVRSSLAPEREFYELIQKNIAARGGEILPIEQRMLKSIDRLCQLSGVLITDVQEKSGDWGGGLRNRLIYLGESEWYAAQQRLPSHVIHGTWVDLVQHHLTEVDKGFQPDPTWSRVDCRLMLPTCVPVLAAAHTYVEVFLSPLPELAPLLERITDLKRRVIAVQNETGEYSGWFDLDKAARFPESSFNHVSDATGSNIEHETLFRTSGGRYVLHWYSDLGISGQKYTAIEAEAAQAWLMTNGHSAEVPAKVLAESEL